MARVNDTTAYPFITPTLADWLTVTDADDANKTKSLLLSALATLLSQQLVLNLDNSKVGDVAVFGSNDVARALKISGGKTELGYDGDDAVLFGEGGVQIQFGGTRQVSALISGATGTFQFARGIREQVGAITGTTPAISVANGTIQTWTLSGNSTPSFTLNEGESLLLLIDDGTGYTLDLAAVDQWAGGSAPAQASTGYTGYALTKVGGTLYGSGIGDFS